MSKLWKRIKAFFARAMLGFEAYEQGQENGTTKMNKETIVGMSLIALFIVIMVGLTIYAGLQAFTFMGTCFVSLGFFATLIQLFVMVLTMSTIAGAFGGVFADFVESIHREIDENIEHYREVFGNDVVDAWMVEADGWLKTQKQPDTASKEAAPAAPAPSEPEAASAAT